MNVGWHAVCEQCSKICEEKGWLKLYLKKHSFDSFDDNKIHERNYVKEAIEKAFIKAIEEKLHCEK